MNKAKHRNTKGLIPFKKGPNPLRWRHGQKSKEVVKISRDIQQWLSVIGEELNKDGKTHAEAVARKLWERSEKGDMRAIEIVLERLLGKAVQPLSGDLNVNAKLSIHALRKSMKDLGQE